jgi:cytochrome bd-type quinol oxidase subunit 2
MFGTVLRLLAVGEAGRRMGAYFKNLMTRYLVLSVAGTAFAAAITFAMLAAFWALNSRTQDPVASALIIAGVLALAGFVIVLVAYGITRRKSPSASLALREPVQTVQGQMPAVDEIGRQIEYAVRQYGAVRVASVAMAGGLVAGLLAKHFRQM